MTKITEINFQGMPKKRNQKDMDKENLEIKLVYFIVDEHLCIYVYNMIIGKPVTLWANSDR